MRTSQLYAPTLRQTPVEAEVVSHQLMLRAGMIRKAAGGLYTYLPLAWRTLRKIEEIIREEMDAAGGQELAMQTLREMAKAIRGVTVPGAGGMLHFKR